MATTVSSFGSVEEIAAALAIVGKKFNPILEEVRELRRELAIHRGYEIEREINEALGAFEYGIRKIERAVAEKQLEDQLST